jgi:hypothetical protein
MPTVNRRESRTCARCSLPLTAVHTSEGKTIEYDIAAWARLCHHPDAGSPLACPSLQPVIKAWLNGS